MINRERTCHEYFDLVARVARQVDASSIAALREHIEHAVQSMATIFIAGNGGNATVAEHLALGLSLNAYRESGRGIRAFALSNGAYATASVNDFGADRMFLTQLEAMADDGDLFIAISASGRSENLATAVRESRGRLRTVAIVGQPGYVSRDADFSLVLNTDRHDVAEDVTIMVLHWLYGTYMVQGD